VVVRFSIDFHFSVCLKLTAHLFDFNADLPGTEDPPGQPQSGNIFIYRLETLELEVDTCVLRR